MSNEIVLGFLEKPKNNLILTAPFNPSKIGGNPAWIDTENVPH